jgi:hypothetical protein
MARPILSFWAAALLTALPLACPASAQAAGKAFACSPSSYAGVPEAQKQQAVAYVRKVQGGPFYKYLAVKFGRALSCAVSAKGPALTVAFTFADGAALRAKVDASIELSEQRMTVPEMPEAAAVALLNRAEAAGYGKGGCGIAWKNPETETLGEGETATIYRGESCNCQGRIVRKPKSVELVLSSAC